MSLAICGGVKDRSRPLTENQKSMEKALADQGFGMKEKFPVLYQWAVDLSAKHTANYSLFQD